MSVRHTDLSAIALTIEGANFFGDLETAGLNVTVTEVDGRGSGSRWSSAVETKRSAVLPFALHLDSASARATALQVSAFTVGSMDLVGDFKRATITVTNQTIDGSGARDRDTYANYAGGSKVVVAGDFMVPLATVHNPAIVAILSNTAADRQLSTSINFGSDTLTMAGLVTGCQYQYTGGDAQMYDLTIANRGAPSSPSSSTLFGRAVAGTGADSLFTVVFNTGQGIITATEACISSMQVSIADGAITKLTGELALRGAPSFATSAV